MLYRRLLEVGAAHSARVVVLTTGWPSAADATQGFLETAESWFAGSGTLFFDHQAEIESALGGSLASYVIRGDTHPNEEGHRFIADVTWPTLSKELERYIAEQGSDSGPCSSSDRASLDMNVVSPLTESGKSLDTQN
jgi:hypothetical protein